MSDLDLIYGTQPKPASSLEEKEERKPPHTSKALVKKASQTASRSASTLASNHAGIIETIRKTVKSLGQVVSFTRVTPEEKGRVADIVYTYKRQGVKTSENEINRIAINFLMEDYKKNGKESVLAQVLEALNA